MFKILKDAESKLQNSGAVAAFFGFFQGRSTAFAIVFTVVGIVLAFRGKLTADYALFVTSVQGLIVAISVKEDWHEQKMTALSQNAPCDTADPPQPPAAATG